MPGGEDYRPAIGVSRGLFDRPHPGLGLGEPEFLTTRTPVETLVGSAGPLDVARLVVTIVVDAIQGVPLRASSQFIIEVLEKCRRVLPFVANRNSTTTVVLVANVLWIETAGHHPLPGVVVGVLSYPVPVVPSALAIRRALFSWLPLRSGLVVPSALATGRTRGRSATTNDKRVPMHPPPLVVLLAPPAMFYEPVTVFDTAILFHHGSIT